MSKERITPNYCFIAISYLWVNFEFPNVCLHFSRHLIHKWFRINEVHYNVFQLSGNTSILQTGVPSAANFALFIDFSSAALCCNGKTNSLNI